MCVQTHGSINVCTNTANMRIQTLANINVGVQTLADINEYTNTC